VADPSADLQQAPAAPEASGGAMLAHLRSVTRPAHDALEGALGLLDERLDLGAYRSILQRFHGFWRLWEPHVAALLQDEAMVAPRRRLHLLDADLAVLGLSSEGRAALPPCPLPELHDAAAALGSLYVMEGSTLGGRVIQRNVGRRLGLDGASGCSYFSGYGERTGMMWRSFLARLDREPMSQAGRIGVGATATFERLAWWLTRP
jgi:heme oxygenase